MKQRSVFSSLLLAALLVALSSTALASTKWYVDGVHGNDQNNCKSQQTACKTIGHAISLASSGDSIMVTPATYTENLTIGISLKVIGVGAGTIIIDGGHDGTVVTVNASAVPVTLLKVTIRHGIANEGGGIYNLGTLTLGNCTVSENSATSHETALGGGIANGGTLTVTNSILFGNNTTGRSSAGGGIANGGTLIINNSTFRGNTANGGVTGGTGGGIFNTGRVLTINNSTFSGNIAKSALTGAEGGAILNSGGTLKINNSTISGNSADGHGGGGGIAVVHGRAMLQNSIVANNSGRNCDGSMTSKGYNLSSDGTCNFKNTGDLNNVNPKLGPLQNNGGPTPTHALLTGSPAIDAGNPNGCSDGDGHLLKTDQRGKPRPDKEDSVGCDMGAFERQKD
jgi:hypothetical protein